ncbi:MAG: carboxypeptidase regulatory-like domain-containing protein [Bryobacteraceae bacterium]
MNHRAPILVSLLLLSTGIGRGQTTFATITGTVADPTGAAVPNVTVTATHTATNGRTSTQSNEAGVYTLAQLKEGEYIVRARAAGFKEYVAQNIVLVARDYRRLDARLEVGAVETSVEVSGGATLIETESARISDTKSAELLKSIPLNTRGIWAFLSLSPNVLQSSTGSTIRFAGSRGNQSHWAIDGTTMSDGVDETQIGPLGNYIESFQEIKLDIANNTAEFGSIGQVTMISKSGTNRFTGNIFDYYSTPWFRARNPFALARGTGVTHTPGGSVGGPVILPKLYNGKDKTFFFYSFETGRGSPPTTVLNPTVPLAAWRQGDFTGQPNVTDPLTGTPFPGNRIPAARLNATALKIQERFYPLPNFGPANQLVTQNYRQNLTSPFAPSNYWTVRGDHRFSDKDSIYGRFTLQDVKIQAWQGNMPTIGLHNQHRYNRALTIAYTHTFRPTLLNEFRYGMVFNNNTIEAPLNGPRIVQELGLQGLAPNLPDITGIPKLSWTGLGLTGLTSLDFRNPGFLNYLQDFQDHVSWFKGRHNMKFGVNIGRVEWDDGAANANLFGSLNFSTRFTGHAYGDFLLGIPTTTARAFAPVRVDRLRTQYDFFAVDDFKVNSRLTVNLGIRYEYHPLWTEEHGMGAMFDIGSGKIVVQDGSLDLVSPLFPRSYVDVVEAKSLGLNGKTIVRSDRNNFTPRVGVAWRPWGNQTVFRAGYGIFFDVVPRNINQGGLPFVLNEPAYTNPAVNPDVILPRVFPSTGSAGPSTVGIPAAINTNLQMPYSMQYSMTIEHSRFDTGFRLSYVGTNTRKGDWSYNINAPVPDGRPYVDKPRRFPAYPEISYFTNGAGHQYNGLTAEAERKMARGLYFQSSWVWARDIGDLERGASPENPFDRARERTVWADIPTHRFTTNLYYQLPMGRGRSLLGNANRLTNLLAGGWDLSTIYSYHSGQFLTPAWSGPDPVGIAFTNSRTPANVTLRPDHLRDANLPGSERSVGRWFDASAFGNLAAGLGRFGTSSRGVIKGPAVNVWHVGLYKTLPITERVLLRWEATATNFFNHPNYSNPATNISQAANVGVISGVGGVNGSSTGDQPFARAFRMGLRFEF